MPKESFDCSDEFNKKLTQTAKKLGFSETKGGQKILEIAAYNFVNYPLDVQMKLVARYHLLRAKELDPDVIERQPDELKALLDDAPADDDTSA